MRLDSNWVVACRACFAEERMNEFGGEFPCAVLGLAWGLGRKLLNLASNEVVSALLRAC